MLYYSVSVCVRKEVVCTVGSRSGACLYPTFSARKIGYFNQSIILSSSGDCPSRPAVLCCVPCVSLLVVSGRDAGRRRSQSGRTAA